MDSSSTLADGETQAPREPAIASASRTARLPARALWFDGLDGVGRAAEIRIERDQLVLTPEMTEPPPEPYVEPPPKTFGTLIELAAAARDHEANVAAAQAAARAAIEAHRRMHRPRRYAVAQVSVAERWDVTPVAVALPDGGTLWVEQGEANAALLSALAARASRSERLVRRVRGRWPIVACTLVLVTLVVWFDRVGAGILGRVALPLVPQAIDQQAGDAALDLMRREWLAASEIPYERRERLRSRFAQAARTVGVPPPRVQVEFHRLRNEAGFNAFALPNGTIVVLDGLAQALSDDEMLAVLGHELSHVQHRHAMQRVVQGFGLLAVAGVVMGDFSTVAAGAASALPQLHNDRQAERQADADAAVFVERAGLPPGTLASLWRKFLARERQQGGSALPDWLSTHPPADERLRRSGQPGAAGR